MRTASSANRTNGASASASEYTATVAMPIARARAHHAQRDLSAVGDQDLVEHRGTIFQLAAPCASPYHLWMRGIAIAVVLGACAHNVPQDSATGKDGNIKGAVPIALEGDAGKSLSGQSLGIVTYPGVRSRGLADGGVARRHGRQARPQDDVHDAAARPARRVRCLRSVARAAREGRLRAPRPHAHRVDRARERTYLVRVYAPKRGDARKYKLVADFTADPPPPPPGWGNLEIPSFAHAPPGGAGRGRGGALRSLRRAERRCPSTATSAAAASWPG